MALLPWQIANFLKGTLQLAVPSYHHETWHVMMFTLVRYRLRKPLISVRLTGSDDIGYVDRLWTRRNFEMGEESEVLGRCG